MEAESRETKRKKEAQREEAIQKAIAQYKTIKEQRKKKIEEQKQKEREKEEKSKFLFLPQSSSEPNSSSNVRDYFEDKFLDDSQKKNQSEGP